jgi:hypothetical protein
VLSGGAPERLRDVAAIEDSAEAHKGRTLRSHEQMSPYVVTFGSRRPGTFPPFHDLDGMVLMLKRG